MPGIRLHPAEIEQKVRIEKIRTIIRSMGSEPTDALVTLVLNVPDHVINCHITRLTQTAAKPTDSKE